MENIVCIELNTDNNYALATTVAITSILHNKKQSTNYHIRVLCNNLTDKNLNLIKNTGAEVIRYKNSFSQFEGKHKFVSSTDLYKFDLADVLSDWDKVLYIDADMIIQQDLSELFNTELGDNYVAAVKDMAGTLLEKHHVRLGLNNYFNAGLMLLNLKKMREDNIREKLIDYKLNKDLGHFMSQDALNYVFNKKVVWLNPKYNYMPSNITSVSEEEICNFYEITNDEYLNLNANPVILHLTNILKPWNTKKAFGYDLWLKYYDLANIDSKREYLLQNQKNYQKIELKRQKSIKNEINMQLYKSFFERIFSVKNDCSAVKHKIITLMGIKIKIKK